jgi:hypothetical protein
MTASPEVKRKPELKGTPDGMMMLHQNLIIPSMLVPETLPKPPTISLL